MKNIILILIGLLIGFIGGNSLGNSVEFKGDLITAESPCVITAKSIKEQAVDYSGKKFENTTRFILPKNVKEIQIEKEIYTKKELDSIKK